MAQFGLRAAMLYELIKIKKIKIKNVVKLYSVIFLRSDILCGVNVTDCGCQDTISLINFMSEIDPSVCLIRCYIG